MEFEHALRGNLLSRDFLSGGIVEFADWESIDDDDVALLERDLRSIIDGFPAGTSPNESQTEDDLIWPVLERFGWTASLRRQNLSVRGMIDVPDGLLFADDEAKRRANTREAEWMRYEHGALLVESKRWRLPLDDGSGRPGEPSTPSTQMLRYLRRADDLTMGRLRWGILTNGARWRLYYRLRDTVASGAVGLWILSALGIDSTASSDVGDRSNVEAPGSDCRTPQTAS